MTYFVVLAAMLDAGVFALVSVRLWRSRHRGASLRMVLFAALATAVLAGAFATGLYAVALDSASIGFFARLVSVAPKAFVLASVLLVGAAGGAALAGRRLARSVEQLAEAASRIAEGEHSTQVPSPSGRDARAIARALSSLRHEAASRPYAAAFLRDAWHDLKTPLAAIRANVELLEDGALEDPVAAKRFVGHVSRSAAELDRRLGDLVTLARLETASHAPKSAIALGAIVARAVERVAPLAEARGVALESATNDGEREVHGDAVSLERAIGNLLENAVDATPGGRVSVRSEDAGRAGIRLDIVNEPASIAKEMRHALSQRGSSTGKDNGSGLGLAIARAAVEAHGGRMTFVELGPPRVRVRIELPR